MPESDKVSSMKIFLIAGARPNFVKIAALWKAFTAFKKFHPKSKVVVRLINTGQHYDYLMSKKIFHDLDLPKPYIDLGVGSASHAVQTARVMESFEAILTKERPDLVMVVGDVNSTLATSLVASKMGIPVAHVEAGLRSFDWTMPEEINRRVTDVLSNYLFTTCEDGDKNLIREGVSKKKIFRVGNVMVDTLLAHMKLAAKSPVKKKLGIHGEYALLTLHRPSNVDNDSDFREILKALRKIQDKIKVIFPVHPRTEVRLKKGKLAPIVKSLRNLKMIPPLGYLDFVNLMKDAKFVLTDSGGVQEETTVLGIPCLTLRNNTERPVTIHEGTNVLAGTKTSRIVSLAFQALNNGVVKKSRNKKPPLWDGKAAGRIVNILSKKMGF